MDLSIIIPTYNRLWSLPEAIESCRKSQYAIEIIVIDDGSTDGTWEWLQSQPYLIAIRQANQGKDWAVNRGFAVANGKYIRFLDSDDLLPPEANDIQIAAAATTDADVITAGHTVWMQDAGYFKESPWVHCDDFIAQQLGECDSSHYSAYIFRKNFIANIPHRQEFGVRDDRMFIVEVALHKPIVHAVEVSCLIHRHHSGERLQFQNGMANSVTNWQHQKIYRRAAERLSAMGEFTPRRRRAMSRILWPLAHWTAYSHLDEACSLADWIFEIAPDFEPADTGAVGLLYRNIGFRNTEKILNFRRKMLALGR